MSVGDWAMIAFWLCNVISWLLCKDWKWEAFWGTSGRYNGVFLMTIYMAVYFLVTRFFKLKQWYLDAFLAVGIFVCVFGITDYSTDSNVPLSLGIVANTVGTVRGALAHTREEWIELSSLENGLRIALALMLDYVEV